jgi:valyl-tRNA synthetase
VSIALAAYPQFESADADAAYHMDVIQKLVTEIRQGRAANKIDKSKVLSAKVTAGTGQASVIEANRVTIERLAAVKLTMSNGTFAVKLDIPIDRARLTKENIELEKVIANSGRQLSNEEIVSKMPEKVVETLRTKLAGYKAQLQKNLDALNGQ